MENEQKNNKRGRPPGATNKNKSENKEFKYKKKYCSDLIKHMKKGKGFTTFTKYLGDTYGEKFAAPKDVLDEWVAEFPEFETALKKGKAYREAHWESNAILAALGQLTYVKKEITHPDGTVEKEMAPARISQALIIFFMKTQFKDSGYVERVELSGADGGPVTMAQIAKKATEFISEAA